MKIILLFTIIALFFLQPGATQNSSTCPDECLTCIGKSICTSCISNYFLKEKQCSKCDLQNQLFVCSRDYFTWKISLPSTFEKKFQLIFSHNFEITNLTEQVQSMIIKLEPNVSSSSYSVQNIQKISSNILEVSLDVSLSFRDQYLTVNFSDPFIYYDNENNFLTTFYQEILVSEFYNYAAIEEEALKISIYVLEGIVLLMFVVLSFSDYRYFFWLFLDSLQTLNIFFYVNTNYPPILWTFLNTLGLINLDFAPSLFYELCLSLANEDNLLTGSIPKRLLEAKKSNSFIKNFGDIFFLLLILLISLFFLIGFMKRHAKDVQEAKTKKFSKEASDSIHSTVLLIVGKNLEWKVILKFLEVSTFNYFIATMIALKYCSFENVFGIIDFTFTITFAITMIFVFYLIFRKINNLFVFIGNKEHYRKYGILFENLDIKRFLARNFSFVIIFQKFFLVFCLIILWEYGYYQIVCVLAVQIIFLSIFLISKPFCDMYQNILFMSIQALLIIVLFFIFGIKVTYEKSKSQSIIEDDNVVLQENLTIVAFVFGLLVYLFFLLGIALLVFKKKREKNKNMIELSNNVSANTSKRTLADKFNMA